MPKMDCISFGGFLLLVLLPFQTQVNCSSTTRNGSIESKLVSNLLSNYDVDARPVTDPSKAMNVTIDLILNAIIEVHEREQILETGVWVMLKWQDDFLKWNPKDYGGIKIVSLKPQRIWRPDIALYNAAGGEFMLESHTLENALINHTGHVFWIPSMIVKTACTIDITYFPWDVQICRMMFGSWTKTKNEVNFYNGSSKATLQLAPNGEWEVLDASAVYREKQYGDCCGPNESLYPDVTFWITLRRKPTFYVHNLIVPCLAITVTALMQFCLPPECGEKVSLGVTVLLAQTVFLLIVTDTLPPKSDTVSIAGQFFGGCIFILSAAAVCAAITVNIHYQHPDNEIPSIIRMLFLQTIAPCVLVSVQQRRDREQGSNQNKYQDNEDQRRNSKDDNNLSTPVLMENSLCKTLQNTTGATNMRKSEWHDLAKVFDRLFFILFAMVIIIVSALILTRRPVIMAKPWELWPNEAIFH